MNQSENIYEYVDYINHGQVEHDYLEIEAIEPQNENDESNK